MKRKLNCSKIKVVAGCTDKGVTALQQVCSFSNKKTNVKLSMMEYLQWQMEHIQSPLLEDFLGQSLFLDFGNGSARNSDIEIISSQEELKFYYQRIMEFFGSIKTGKLA
ncbi:uncharacterized protein [Arachis hypogaea]|uniref:uncharacterized protein n=1 Tax=Arachis hypogaea TaxID=3818 RepID=UPI0034E631D4